MTELVTVMGASRHPLAEARRRRGWSQEGLAVLLQGRGLGTTRRTVARWERGVVPDAAAQRALCDMFGVNFDVAVRMGWPYWLPTGDIAAVAEPWDHDGTMNALDKVAKGALVDRREFIVLAGAELLLPVYEWRTNTGPWITARENGIRQVSSTLVDEIERLVAIRRRMDDEHGGGGKLLDMLHADLGFVVDLLKNGSCEGNTSQRLYSCAGEIARLAGWVAFDSARHAAAQQYYLAALRSAAAVGDHALGVNIVGFMGIQAYSTGRVSDARQLMDVATAEATKKTPTIVQAMTWARAGRAYAKYGDSQTAHKALDNANRLLGRAIDGDTPPWAYWVDEARVTNQLGRALFDLGDYSGAERELAAAIEAYGDSYPRDRAKLLGCIATARLRTGNLEGGCDSGRRAVDLLAGQVDSAGGIGFLQTFQKELSSYTASPVARDFIQYAAMRMGTDRLTTREFGHLD